MSKRDVDAVATGFTVVLFGAMILAGLIAWYVKALNPKTELEKRHAEQYSSSSGKPVDMPQQDWAYVNNQMRQATGATKSEAETATQAIWKFEKARKAREGN